MEEDQSGSNRALAKHAQAIDHLAIAVRDLEASIDWYTRVLGFSVTERRRTDGSVTGMVSAVLKAGELTVVLLEGTSSASQVSIFVDNYGPGVQHIAIRVADIESAVNDLERGGLKFDTPIIGQPGLRQIFSQRDKASGLMLEIIQRTGDGFDEQNVSQLFEALERSGSF